MINSNQKDKYLNTYTPVTFYNTKEVPVPRSNELIKRRTRLATQSSNSPSFWRYAKVATAFFHNQTNPATGNKGKRNFYPDAQKTNGHK